MQQFSGAGYDRAITVFSPDGRLFQVEYAREAVKRGTTSIGIKSTEGVAFVVDKKVRSKLVEPSSIEKIFKIDEHIASASSGLVADARRLIDVARNQAQVNRIQYHEPIPVGTLAKNIGDIKQMYTQNGGVRPFGISLIIGGVSDDECKIFETDPSGALVEYKATAIGFGRERAMEIFENKYEDDLSLDETIDIALEAIYAATDGKTTDESVEIAIIDKETAKYRKLNKDEITQYVEKMLDRIEKEKKEAEEEAKKAEEEAKKAEEEAKKAEEEAKEDSEEDTDSENDETSE